MTKRRKKLSVLKKEAKQVFQRYIRLKESGVDGYVCCVTCPKTGYWEGDGFDAGHFIPATCSATCFLEENVHPQCKGCNGFGMSHRDTIHAYYEYMEKEYGQEVIANLRSIRHQVTKRTAEDYQDIIDEYLDKIVGLSIKKGLV